MTKPSYTLHRGDNINALRAMLSNSVDSVVTDPPYGLSDHKPGDVVACLTAWLAGEEYRPKKKGFMGRTWDSWVPGPEVWREVYRVLKPGGHVVAFAGSRTHDLMSMALRLAGFECRDTVMWVYGSGFPKSMDVSKAIDKLDATEARRARQLRFTEWMRGTGLAASRIDEITGTNMGSHYTTAASQPSVPTRDHLEKLRPHLNCEVPRWVEQMVDDRTIESENFRMREVVAVAMGTDTRRSRPGIPLQDGMAKHEYSITDPATDAARQWAGWGTALKPAFEPALLFRKPLAGTVAENVMAHGTGALNIDGCRVPHADQGDEAGYREKCASVVGLGSNRNGSAYGEWTGERQDSASALGRFPANLIHDGSPEVLAHFPDSNGAGPSLPRVKVTGYGGGIGSGESAYMGGERIPYNAGSGSAARFFYCPKASKLDRDEGLDGMTAVHRPNGNKWTDRDYRVERGERESGWESGPRKNIHPTVKPTDLMRYLCRLVTPPGGLVLDPFTGSGSTGKAALIEGFSFIGCELLDSHADIAEARLKHAMETAAQDLFFGLHNAA